MAGGGDVRIIGANARVKDGVANVTGHSVWVRITEGTIGDVGANLKVNGSAVDHNNPVPIRVIGEPVSVATSGVPLEVEGIVDARQLGLWNVGVTGPVEIVEPFDVDQLSASTGGRPIDVPLAATTIHTVPSGKRDLVTLYVTNRNSTDEQLVLAWGGSAAADDMHVFLPSNETVVAANSIPLDQGLSIMASIPLGAGTGVSIVGQVVRRDR